MKKCAYCAKEKTLTREHIWPNSIVKKFDEKPLIHNPRKNNMYRGDSIIKDVCASCNNQNLSQIDNYLTSLYDQFFYEIIKSGDKVNFTYKYELLLRGLLKISFNSARAQEEKDIATAHKALTNYILRGGYHSGVMLRLQIVTSSKAINIESGEEMGLLKPEQLRVALITYDGELNHRFMIRLVAINSYWFYIIISRKREPKHKWKKFLEGFSNWKIQPGLLLGQNSSNINIGVEQTTYMDPELLGNLVNALKNTPRSNK